MTIDSPKTPLTGAPARKPSPRSGTPTLEEALRVGVSPREAKRLGLRIAKALAALHARGDVHGELTPRSIELLRGGELQIVPLDAEESAQARLRYASPEVARREVPTAASDVFAMSLLLRELIEGIPARRGSLDQLAMEAIDGRVSVAHGLEGELASLAALAVSPHQENRPTASEFVAALGEKRRFRGFSRQDWVVAGLAVVAVAMLAMLLRASVEERDRSNQQYEDARAAFEGFLGGIYPELDRIEDIGPLAAAGGRALASMESRRDDERSEDDRELFARTLAWNAEAQRILENEAEATALFERAAERALLLVNRDLGKEIELRAETALAELARERRENTESAKRFLKAKGIGNELVKSDPESRDKRVLLARALMGFGDLSMSTGLESADRARSIFRTARDVLEHPSVAGNGHDREVLEIRANLDKLESIMAWASGETEAAVKLLERHVEEAQHLVEVDPGRARRRWMLARGASNLASARLDTGDLPRAVDAYRKSVEGWRLLRAMEPDEIRWRREWARTTRELATVLAMTGEWQESATLHDVSLSDLVEMYDANRLPADASVEIAEQMIEASDGLHVAGDLIRSRESLVAAIERLGERAPNDRVPVKRRWIAAVARTMVLDAELLLAEGKWRAAETAALDVLDHIQELVEEGNHSALRIERARALLVSSAVRAMDGHGEIAVGARDRALAIADELLRESPGDLPARSLRARTLFVLGRDAEAAEVLEGLEEIGYRGLELSAVRAATGALRR